MEEASLVESMKREMNGDHCLFGMCVSNVYGVPFEVSLARNGADGQGEQSHRHDLILGLMLG